MATETIERDPTGLNRPLRTWLLRNIGYDGNRTDNPLMEVTDYGFIEAVRQLDGLEKAVHVEKRVNIPGCSTYHVYAQAPRETGADWTKIGMMRDETPSR